MTHHAHSDYGPMIMTYLGLTPEEWQDLLEYRHSVEPGVLELALENAKMRGQLEFLKSKVAQMHEVLK